MKNYSYQRLSVLLLLLALIGVGMALSQQAISEVAAQAHLPKTLDRNLEPVILKGSQVANLLNSPVGELFAYRFNGSALEQIPIQVDEVTTGGDYTTSEDDLLDANDEIVFMAADLGDRPADPAALLGALPIDTWQEIKVTDPLDPTRQGWAYLVHSTTLTPSGDDYVDYDAGNRRINAAGYSLGLATTQPGLDYLNQNGSGDILDRTKLRVKFTLITLYENDLQDPATSLIKDGPVRVIIEQSVAATPGGVDPVSARLDTTNLAYASLVQSTASVSFTLFPLINITNVRTSLDFNSTIASSGVATFYNASTPAGVPIDGSPDTVAATPFSHWGQVTHPYGRIVQVTDPSPIGGSPTTYYCDNNNPAAPAECDGTSKTGDDVSYGDSGLSITGNINSRFSTESWLFFLPPAGSGEADNVGDAYEDYFNHPLGQSRIFLPLIVKSSR